MKKEDFSLSVKDKKLLDNLEISVFNSAMEVMQKLQCNSRYVRFQSPSIVSPRLSPLHLKYIETKGKEKKNLPPLNAAIKPKLVPFYNKQFGSKNLKEKVKNIIKTDDTNNANHDKDLNFLAITGLCNVRLSPFHEDIEKQRKKLNHEYRRMSISFLENEKREKYYERYYEKQRRVSLSKLERQKSRVRVNIEEEKGNQRSMTDNTNYNEEVIETCEISLQTPAYFNNNNNSELI